MTSHLSVNGSWTAHVNGAAALVNIRYLKNPSTVFTRGITPFLFNHVVCVTWPRWSEGDDI
jgi:hypothetical protein